MFFGIHSRASSRRTNGISQSFEHPLKPDLKGLPVDSSIRLRGIPSVLRHACAEQPRLSTFELAAVARFGETFSYSCELFPPDFVAVSSRTPVYQGVLTRTHKHVS